MSETNLIHNRRALGVIGLLAIALIGTGVYFGTKYYADKANESFDKANQTLDAGNKTDNYVPEAIDGSIETYSVPPDDAPLTKDDIKLPTTGE